MVVTTASVQAALAKEPGLTAAQWHAALSLLTFREVGAAVAVGFVAADGRSTCACASCLTSPLTETGSACGLGGQPGPGDRPRPGDIRRAGTPVKGC
jgi:hypothetical protein